ncbi:MAG: hypothetical protein QOD10_2714 [Mycobacterium sp.]|jgi:hypothetical protein|nr:hypothetical protein [Mycobacterium sp.]
MRNGTNQNCGWPTAGVGGADDVFFPTTDQISAAVKVPVNGVQP